VKEGEIIDRYVVEGIAGAGAGGVVYRVRHRSLGTLHALKVLARVPPSVQRRFARDARIQSRLRHPNVVRVTDVLEVDGQPALLAEFVDGRDLAQVLVQERLPLAPALGVFRQIVAGVAAAHALGIVHRDLKPQNILVEEVDGALLVKVSDFGIAAGMAEEETLGTLTRTGVSMGTPAYMAPEQGEDAHAVDHRADIFSLGCILYELLTGTRPFVGNTVVALALATSREAYTPLELRLPDLPTGLHSLVRDCLRADPSLRPSNCAELQARLDAVDLGQAALVEATPTPSTPVPGGALPAGGTLVTAGESPVAPRADRGLSRLLFAMAGALVLVASAWGAWQAWAPPTAEAPAEAVATEAVPAEMGPAEASPAEASPAEASPAEASPAEASLVAPAPALATAAPVRAVPPSRSAPRPVVEEPAVAPAMEAVVPSAPPAASPVAAPPTSAASSTASSAASSAATGGGSRYRVEGGAATVRLVGDGGSFVPGPVPPGRYLVRARFDGGAELDAGYVSVRAEATTVITCSATFQQCQRKP